MAKGKAKINSSEDVALPEFRSLRSRKRKCPSDELSLTEEVQATLLPTQECTTLKNQQGQAAKQSYLTKQGHSMDDKHAEETSKTSQGREETTVTYPNNYPQLQSCTVNPEYYINKEGNREITPQEVTWPPCQTHPDQYQVLTSEEGSGSSAADMEEQLCANKNSHCNLERNPKTSQEEPTVTFMDDVREITNDSAAGLPARKKRRMGMCGLTEKERSHFLQTQKRENGQNEAEMVKQQICNNTADLVSKGDILSPPPLPSSPVSIPVDSVTEHSEAEIKLQSSHCEGDNRAGTEVSISATIQDVTIAFCYPRRAAGKGCRAERGTMIDPEQTGEPKSDPPIEGKVEGHLGNLKQQELEGSTAEIKNRDAESKKDENDGSVEVDGCPFISFPTNPSQNEWAEKKKDVSEASPLQVHSEIRTRAERKEKIIGGDGAEAGVSSADTGPAGFSCGSVQLCEVAVTTSDPERKNSCDPGVEPVAGPSAVNTEHTQTRDTTDPFGSGYLDYVSDSQLNSTALIEEEMMKREEDCGSLHCHEDATDLICGLIRELSSLNRNVMATHRELENLCRSSKTSRSSID